ncbi:hypothetical protein NO2_1108, partial [Candidatus Termititenax persephonae]
KEGTQVTINGVPVPVTNGAFLARLSLSEGRNIISVEGVRQTQLVRVMYVRPFIDKQGAAADNLKYNLSRQYVNYARFDGDQPITRGEIQLILNGFKGTTGGNTTSSENITYRNAARLLNSWDGKPADAVEITEGVLDSGLPLTRDQFINLLANTATYKNILARNNDFEDYAETAAAPADVENRADIISRAEDLNARADARRRVSENDYQNFLLRYDNKRLAATTISRSGDSIAADGMTKLIVVTPPDNFRTNQALLSLSGYSGGLTEVQINGSSVPAAPDSSFTAEIALAVGRNVVAVGNGTETIRLTGLRLLTYPDIQGIPEQSLIEQLATLGYFNRDENFFPERDLTREEVAALLVKMLGVNPPPAYQAVFTDVAPNRWSAPSIKYLVDHNVIKDRNAFRPATAITRQDAYNWFKQLSRGNVRFDNPGAGLTRAQFVRWLFVDDRVRAEIARLNR